MNNVSIVIPSYNNKNLLSQCVQSLITTDWHLVKDLIIVDNNSNKETKTYLKKINKEKIKIIYNSENIGFARANNQGIKIASGEYLVLLNNDTLVTKNWLIELINVAERDQQIGIVGSLLFYPDDKHIQHAGIRVAVNNLGDIYPHHIHRLEYFHDVRDRIKTEPFQVVTAACMLIKQTVVKKIGLLDEEFINCYEDVDLCFRAKHQGFEVYLAHKSKVYHYESMSPGRRDNENLNQHLLDKKWAGIMKPDRSWVAFCCGQTHLKQKYISDCVSNIDSGIRPKLITSFGKK